MENIKKQLSYSLDAIDAIYDLRDYKSFIDLIIMSSHTYDDIVTLRNLCDGYSFEGLSFGDIGSLIFRESTILISTKASDDKLFTPLSYDSTSISISATELLTQNDK